MAAAGRPAGFTLIEVLVVLVIMGMAYALAAPMLHAGLAGTELKSAARQVAAGLRKARVEAVARKQDVAVTFDVEQRDFYLSNNARHYGFSKEIEVRLFTASNELLDERSGAIRFFPDGSASGGRVTLTRDQAVYRVDVDWMTGRVAISQ